MNRRAFLTALGLAPLAAIVPAVASTATKKTNYQRVSNEEFSLVMDDVFAGRKPHGAKSVRLSRMPYGTVTADLDGKPWLTTYYPPCA